MAFPLVYLAAGHGGADSGAMDQSDKISERDTAIIITDEAARILREQGIKVEVEPHSLDTHQSIVRINKRYPTLRSAFGVELHRDWGAGVKEPRASFCMGVYTGPAESSRRVGAKMLAAFVAAGADKKSSWDLPDTESRFGRLGWIRQPKAFTVLIEHGFMQGRNDKDHLLKLAAMSAAGIIAGYNS